MKPEENPLLYFPIDLVYAHGALSVQLYGVLETPETRGCAIRKEGNTYHFDCKGADAIAEIADRIGAAYDFWCGILDNPSNAVREEWEATPKKEQSAILDSGRGGSFRWRTACAVNGVELEEPGAARELLDDLRQQRCEVLRKLLGVAVDVAKNPKTGIRGLLQEAFSDMLNPKQRKRIKHIPYKVAIAILKELHCPKKRKTLQRWMKGKNTPEGFTPECMENVPAFTAWATIYANKEQSKINYNNALRIDNPANRKMGRFR